MRRCFHENLLASNFRALWDPSAALHGCSGTPLAARCRATKCPRQRLTVPLPCLSTPLRFGRPTQQHVGRAERRRRRNEYRATGRRLPKTSQRSQPGIGFLAHQRVSPAWQLAGIWRQRRTRWPTGPRRRTGGGEPSPRVTRARIPMGCGPARGYLLNRRSLLLCL